MSSRIPTARGSVAEVIREWQVPWSPASSAGAGGPRAARAVRAWGLQEQGRLRPRRRQAAVGVPTLVAALAGNYRHGKLWPSLCMLACLTSPQSNCLIVSSAQNSFSTPTSLQSHCLSLLSQSQSASPLDHRQYVFPRPKTSSHLVVPGAVKPPTTTTTKTNALAWLPRPLRDLR